MGRGADNIRRALEADGADEAEIVSTLVEMGLDEPADPRERALRAGVPTLYVGQGFDSIERDGNEEAIEEARRWASGEADFGLFLWSDGYGNSKTLIAAAAVQQMLVERPRRVRWLDVVRLMTDLNLPFRNPQYERAAARLQPPDREVIILDDLDKIPATDRNIQPIFALVNDCVNAQAPLIITANRDLDAISTDFGDRFGRALASRLVGHCLDVEVTGRDHRVEP